MKYIFIVIFLGIGLVVNAQSFELNGQIYSDKGTPLIYSSVVLLNPVDSTLVAFGITNKSGEYSIKNIKEGEYLLQASFLGFKTHYQSIQIPVDDNVLAGIVLQTKSENLGEVEVSGEYIPLAIKKDTVEYNAKAFKLKPDAVAEDLLKKLPGVEVDRAGNIKAMGEDVNKLFVDGKEFFGNDPKVATKNVPANALDKVQIYDRKSEEAMFTGIDDGSRQKALNLQLKEDKKNALFGDVMAGGGSNERWQGSAKAYRFNDKIQLAALGMANNVNQFGFSFNDYMNFSGGIGKMIHGGGSAKISITSDGSFPINFGESISGLNTSGAGGANFSFSKHKHNRTFISYLGSGTEKKLLENTKSWNFQKENNFYQEQDLDETDKNQSHRFNFGVRKRIDSTQNILLDGNVNLGSGNNHRIAVSESSGNMNLINRQKYVSDNETGRLSGNARGSYTKIFSKGKSNLSAGGNVYFSKNISKNEITTETKYFENDALIPIHVNQDDNNEMMRFSLNVAYTRSFGKGFYFTSKIETGNSTEDLDRLDEEISKPDFSALKKEDNLFLKHYTYLRPEINLKKTNDKRTLALTLRLESGKLGNDLNGNPLNEKKYLFFVPSFMYQYEFQTGRRLMLYYNSSVITPAITQLLPIRNERNPLSVYYGNPDLKPEHSHRFNTHYILFDQFSFTSLMASLNANYTKNKINWDRSVDQNLAITNTLQNFDYDYNVSGNIDFSTPIRKLGIKIHFNADETLNRGLNMINKVENEYTNLIHRLSFSVDNRKKEKWDANTGIAVTLSNSRYSVQKELDNNYFDLSWFADLRFTPGDSWNFEVNTDITNYTDKSFNEDFSIPLLGAEINHYFLKNKRGTLTLKGFDLLNKNQLVKRFGELNYLREIRSNSIGRFVMLSFTYRLNKFGKSPGGIDIKMKK